jgi:hypothetical protein
MSHASRRNRAASDSKKAFSSTGCAPTSISRKCQRVLAAAH